MFIIAIISVLNLVLGFAAAVMLGYGPRPWWSVFADPAASRAVRIEKLEDEVAESVEPTDQSEDEQDDSDESELDEDHEEEEDEDAVSESNRLQEINAEKLAKRMEAERRTTASAAKKQATQEKAAALQPTAPQDEAELEEEAGLGISAVIDGDEVDSLLSTAATPSPAASLDDVDESLDEIESLLKAAGQLEAEPNEADPTEAKPAAEASSVPAEADKAEPAERELNAAEIDAMFN